MSNEMSCRFCGYCDTSRTKGDKVRCRRFSQWVDPYQEEKCYLERFAELVDAARKLSGMEAAQ